VEYCLPWHVPYTGAGEECHEEGAAQTKCYERTATPIPKALLHSEEEVEELAAKLSLGRREGSRKVF